MSGLIGDSPLPQEHVILLLPDGDKVALVKIEVITMAGNGKLNISGTNSATVKEDIKNTYNYMRGE